MRIVAILERKQMTRPANASIAKADLRSMNMQDNECEGVLKTKVGDIRKDDVIIFLSTALLLTVAVFMCFCFLFYWQFTRKKTCWKTDIVKEYSSGPSEKNLHAVNLFTRKSTPSDKNLFVDKNLLPDKNLIPDKNIIIEKTMDLEKSLLEKDMPLEANELSEETELPENHMSDEESMPSINRAQVGDMKRPGSTMPFRDATPPRTIVLSENRSPHENLSSPEKSSSFEKNTVTEKIKLHEKSRFTEKKVVHQSDNAQRDTKVNFLRPPSIVPPPERDSSSPMFPKGKGNPIYEENSSSVSDSSSYTKQAHKVPSSHQQSSRLKSPIPSGLYTKLGDVDECQSPDCPGCTCSPTRTYKSPHGTNVHFETMDEARDAPNNYKYCRTSSTLPSEDRTPTLGSGLLPQGKTKPLTRSRYPLSDYSEGKTKFPSLFRP
ncbi:hypothetical protein NDU88_009433 [Pleurodeles waltl]|uniref:Uncharacterized protein n=1 Tax=Pleurodeles waltl TaxID=8319 RepID=A0AAV7RZ05_PLEWA|nr:hypothetical protein NDU88_009433 [Pleurodeles waltl]